VSQSGGIDCRAKRPAALLFASFFLSVPVFAAAAEPGSCALVLEALDASGRELFHVPAAGTARGDVAIAPLEPLERGGVRWATLRLVAGDGTRFEAAALLERSPERDLASLRAPGLPACATESTALPSAGDAVTVRREARGYRGAAIGGRVDRLVALPSGRSLLLIHLLDDRGTDAGMVFDTLGRPLGSAVPGPASGDGALTAVVAASAVDTAGESGPLPREALVPRPTAAFLETVPGLVSQALRVQGPARFERALALLDEAAKSAEPTPAMMLERGVVEYGLGRLPAAVVDFTRAAERDPRSYLARYNLGVALGSAGRYLEAAQAFSQARDLNPGHSATRYQLALALLAARRPQEARREADSLASLDPALAGQLRDLLARP
jgi:superkiller protein 3